jgi:hypothetical protein
MTAALRPQLADRDVSEEIFEFKREITPDTCKSKWCGEELDMDLAIQALLSREGNAF